MSLTYFWFFLFLSVFKDEKNSLQLYINILRNKIFKRFLFSGAYCERKILIYCIICNLSHHRPCPRLFFRVYSNFTDEKNINKIFGIYICE